MSDKVEVVLSDVVHGHDTQEVIPPRREAGKGGLANQRPNMDYRPDTGPGVRWDFR